jgi:polysaccharide export outer membrane protein
LLLAALIGFVPLWASERSDYKIAPGDKLYVDVFGEKDLQRDVDVSAKGEFTFPLLGTVKAKGLTLLELQNKLRQDLEKDFLVDPQVTVSMKGYRKRTVTILGQVGQPGLLELPGEQQLTVLEAIASRGGFARDAKKSSISVARPGVAKPFEFTEEELKKDSDPDKAFLLQNGDIITVGERFW